jgi:anti-anti-sigma regulatory factor
MSECVFRQDGLLLTLEQSDGTATIAWEGVSDSRFPAQFLNPLFQEWVQKVQGSRVVVDLRRLEYMNSATVMPLIQMVRQLDASAQQVRVLFLDVDWQRTHGNCMKAIARTLKNVQVDRQPIAQQ